MNSDNTNKDDTRRKATKLKNGVVTFLDVLGWKGIWKEDQLAIANLMELINKTKKKSQMIIRKLRKNENLYVKLHERGKKDVFLLREKINVEVLSISDTIILTTESDDINKAIEIHAEICSWLLVEAMKVNLPLRGAISCGNYDNQDHIVIGPAVDEAASWHESTDWIGVILTPSAKFSLHNNISTYITKYESIPFKKSIKGLDLCVDWKYGDKTDNDIYSKFINKAPHMQEVAPKYLNTLLFLERDNNTNIK